MSRQNSLMAAMATVLGATLGGLVLWRSFLTQRKRLTQGPSPSAALETQQTQPLQEKKLQQQPQKQKQTQESPQCPAAAEPDPAQVVPEGLQLPPPPPPSPPPASLASPRSLLDVTPAVVSSAEEWEALWPSLQQDLLVYPVLGLDCEWVKGMRVSVKGKPSSVSLLQMATYTGQCALVRLQLFQDALLPSTLVEVLSDLHVLKVGVGCFEDGKRLAHDHGLVLRCTVDLRFLAQRQRHVALTNGLSLKSLASDLLDVTLDKSLDLRCSDWEADQLSPEQVSYAARDAQVSAALFFHLLSSPTGPTKSPAEPSPAPPEGGSSSAYSRLASRCQGLLDVPFRGRHTLGSVDGERRRTSSSKKLSVDSPESGDQRVPDPRKNKRKPLGVGYSARKSPLYDNCFLHAPDGQPLCTCDKKKAKWYLDKGIGELQSEDPFIVRLLFEPSGRPETQQDYYLTAKQNLCVVCGKADSYIRKNIVPHEYRRYFPAEMKDHNCHDILLLCTACHAASCTHDGQLKQRLAQEHGAPQGCEEGVRLLEDAERRRVRSAARALLTARDGLPQARRTELLLLIAAYMQQDAELTAEQPADDYEVTQDMLQKAAGLETRIFNEGYVPHGLKVVGAYAKSGLRGLMDLERLWRQHFLSSMRPRFLPPLWSVSHNHDKYLRKYGEDLVIELSTAPGSPQPSSPPSTPPEAQ